jgi:hypothetical protein
MQYCHQLPIKEIYFSDAHIFRKKIKSRLTMNHHYIYNTTEIVIRITASAWSWNEINCPMNGDALSCKFIFAHVSIV